MFRLKRLFSPLYAPLVRRFRRAKSLRAQRRRIRTDVRQCRAASRDIKIIIGAGETRYDGWIATDIPAFDILNPAHWAQLFPPKAIDRMLAEHVFEHLTTAQLGEFLQIAGPYLAPAARIRIAVPDGHHPDANYIERVRPGGSGIGADDHKVLYTWELISEVLGEFDFHYQLLEYFDAEGTFHRHEWSEQDGFIRRSAKYDRRNADGDLNFTSLIIDCWI